jgi:hypothetical protein
MMKVKDCRNMDDVIKYIIAKWEKSWFHTLEIEQIKNWLIITYGKIIEEEKKSEENKLNLVFSTKIKKDNEMPVAYRRVRLNLCNFIEPRKSRKEEYRRMWEDATTLEEESKNELGLDNSI